MVAEALTPGPTPTGPGAHARQGQGEGRYAGQRNLTLPVSFFKVQELPGTSTPGKRSVLPIFSKHERGGSVVWRHLRSILQLPFLVVVVVPTLILYFTDAINVGWSLAAPLNWMVTLAGGLVFGATPVLRRGVRGHQSDLHSPARRTRPGSTLRRVVPPLQAARAALDSTPDALDSAGRSAHLTG